MGMLKKALVLIASLMVLFCVVGVFLPADYRVERSIIIEAPPEHIYSQLVDLTAWQGWGVWFKRDPSMVIDYSGPDRAIGMKSVWRSESEGNGEMEITALVHDRMLQYRLYFPDFDMGSTGEFLLEQTEQGTKVTWVDAGEVGMNPIDRYFALLMDSMIGPDFEAGLENLKTIAENQRS